MRLTKYAQSCVLIESDGTRIVIDPGNLLQQNGTDPEEFKGISAVLLTHKHSDHCFPGNLKAIRENNPDAAIYCSKEVSRMLRKEGIDQKTVSVGDVFPIGNVEIEVVEAVHGFHYTMNGTGAFPKDNNGYVIRGEGKTAYHAGDTLAYESKVRNPDVALVPVSGNAVVMEPGVAVDYCRHVINAKCTVPMHYHSPKHPLGADRFEEEAKKQGLNYKILGIGESIEL